MTQVMTGEELKMLMRKELGSIYLDVKTGSVNELFAEKDGRQYQHMIVIRMYIRIQIAY